MDIKREKLQIHKQAIKNLTEDLIKAKNLQGEIIIKDKIKMQQVFLDSLYNILNTYEKNSDDNILNTYQKNSDENNISIRNEMINKNEKNENIELENNN